jgi:hypothetical protein
VNEGDSSVCTSAYIGMYTCECMCVWLERADPSPPLTLSLSLSLSRPLFLRLSPSLSHIRARAQVLAVAEHIWNKGGDFATIPSRADVALPSAPRRPEPPAETTAATTATTGPHTRLPRAWAIRLATLTYRALFLGVGGGGGHCVQTRQRPRPVCHPGAPCVSVCVFVCYARIRTHTWA